MEEFIGYPFIGGNTVYDYEIEKSTGNYNRIKVWANIHGSKIEKTITLYGFSEILEVNYRLNDIDKNITVVGINPLIELGRNTGPEDVYYFPVENDSVVKRSPDMSRYYGNTFFLKENWVGGQDTIEGVSLVIGFPLRDVLLMHLWNNHPNNTPTPYYYAEWQPWIKINHETTNYFTYYLIGKQGDYRGGVDMLRNYGLLIKKDE